MNANLIQQVQQWIANDPDSATRNELQTLLDENNETELSQRFAGRLEFGTAGLRGVVGAGPTQMNRLVIQQTSAGLGQYLLNTVENAANRGVIIGYDGRTDSKRFAHDAAAVLAAQGIKVMLTHTVAPTPLVAFGVLHLSAAAGIVVTASHNPPEYNGFKVYWDNGAQIIPPHDSGIATAILEAAEKPLPYLPTDEARDKGILTLLENSFYQEYRSALNNMPELKKQTDDATIAIAYTAMHGVGANLAETLLKDAGFNKVYSVAAQREPDGSFPTVNFPNPEEKGAMDLVIAEAKKHNAELACANDPDADRFAVAAKTNSGEYKMLTGDQVGILFAHSLLQNNQNASALVGNTIVSSSMLEKVTVAAGAEYYQTLTGFKWLTNVAMQKQTDQTPFLFAYEEALGYTVGNCVLDKDGLSALVAFAQLAEKLANEGKTVWDQLEELYRQHGLYLNAQRSIALQPGSPNIGEALRAAPPKAIAGSTIVTTDDLKHGLRTHHSGEVEPIDLPSSDVLIYRLANQARVIVRPSGTEPKLKCYYEVVKPLSSEDDYSQAQDNAVNAMEQLIEQHQASLA